MEPITESSNKSSTEAEERKTMMACMQKLALWYTRCFRPLITHDDLEPIMSTLGFVPSPTPLGADAISIPWKEYLYSAGRGGSETESPRPRLPYPRIDGLHVYTYKAFLDAVNFHLKMANISDLFHVRGMPLHNLHDRGKKWSRIEEDESNFVYWEGTLDQTVANYYRCEKNAMNVCDSELRNTMIRSRGKDVPTCAIVPLNDIIVKDHSGRSKTSSYSQDCIFYHSGTTEMKTYSMDEPPCPLLSPLSTDEDILYG